MKKLLLHITVFYSSLVYAQQQNPFMKDANGRPLYLHVNYVAEGSPYLFEDYNLAEVTSINNVVYYNIRVKINVVDSKILYLSDNDEEMIATTPIKSVKFLNVVKDGKLSSMTLTGFSQSMNAPGTDMYHVIDSGKVSLLKKITITYRDDKKYGDAVITRYFDRRETDFVLLPTGEFRKVEKGKVFMLDILKDKSNVISNYIDSNNIKSKNTEDYKQIIHYYNSLN